jgi:hypothetical protein
MGPRTRSTSPSDSSPAEPSWFVKILREHVGKVIAAAVAGVITVAGALLWGGWLTVTVDEPESIVAGSLRLQGPNGTVYRERVPLGSSIWITPPGSYQIHGRAPWQVVPRPLSAQVEVQPFRTAVARVPPIHRETLRWVGTVIGEGLTPTGPFTLCYTTTIAESPCHEVVTRDSMFDVMMPYADVVYFEITTGGVRHSLRVFPRETPDPSNPANCKRTPESQLLCEVTLSVPRP